MATKKQGTTSQSEQEKEFLDHLRESFLADRDQTFLVNQPTTLTERSGSVGHFTYRKRPTPGGEKLRPIDAYIGKRNQLIIIFYKDGPNEKYYEIPIKQAIESLDSFRLYFEDIMGDHANVVIQSARKHVTAMENKITQAAREERLNDPELAHYGSW